MAVLHVHGSFIFLYIFLINSALTYANSDTEALLKLKKSFANASALDSWTPEAEPCTANKQWIGVLCESGVVSGLRLGNFGLSGKVDVDALVYLSGLRSISFVSNSFSGPIPDFHRMGALKGLYLSDNQFSGEIPSDYFKKMEGLKKVWLSGNNFSGTIPSSLLELPHLMELHFESNQFSGLIPPLKQQSLISLDLSNNDLEGEIPPSLSRFSADSFKGNANLCGGSSGKSCDSSERSSKSGRLTKIAFWIVLVLIVLLSVTIIVIRALKRRQESSFRKNLENPLSFNSESSVGRKDFESNGKGIGSSSIHRAGSSQKGANRGKGVGDLVMVNDEKGEFEFGLADLMKSAAEVLGNGALGSSYKAMMMNGLTVAVKRIKEMSKMSKEQFDSEIRRFARLKHKNVLTPLAYHYRKDEKLLVFEFMPKGSLLHVLHGDRGIPHAELNWPVRFQIILGIARGLGYLQIELCALDLPHGNLKSSNVLLTPNNEPLLVDYGLCSLISGIQASQTLAAYKSPEATLHYDISPKCDVYSLGVLILEILTGKFPSQYVSNGKGGIDLVQWVRSAISEGKETDLFDPDIASAKEFSSQMQQLLQVAVACTESKPEQRLDVTDAVKMIEDIRA